MNAYHAATLVPTSTTATSVAQTSATSATRVAAAARFAESQSTTTRRIQFRPPETAQAATKRRASVRFLPLPTQLAFSLCLQKVRLSVKLEQNPVDSQEGGPMNSERDIITVDLTEVTRANFGEFLESVNWKRAHERPTRLVQIGQGQPLELTRAGLWEILNPGRFAPVQ